MYFGKRIGKVYMISSHFYIIPDYEIRPRFGQEKAPFLISGDILCTVAPLCNLIYSRVHGIIFSPLKSV